MKVVISLLRGVNVGRNKIKMDALRDLYAGLGLLNPCTHIQSGNVIFATKARSLPALAQKLGGAIRQNFGFCPDVILRTPAELRDVLARNPFAARAGIQPGKLLVTFLAQAPGPEAHARLRQLAASPDELVLDGRELYAYYPNGISGATLPAAAIDRALKTRGTGRNWNTVTKLLALAEAKFTC